MDVRPSPGSGQSDEEPIIIRNHSQAQTGSGTLASFIPSPSISFHHAEAPCFGGEERSDSQHNDALTQKYKFQCPESLSLQPKVINYQSSSNKLETTLKD